MSGEWERALLGASRDPGKRSGALQRSKSAPRPKRTALRPASPLPFLLVTKETMEQMENGMLVKIYENNDRQLTCLFLAFTISKALVLSILLPETHCER